MIGAEFFSRRFLVFPPGMSDAEKHVITEQARREAFTRDDTSATALFTDAIITLFTILFIAVGVMLAFAVFVGEDSHLLAGPVLIALIIVFAVTLATLVRERQRAKLLNPVIKELVEARNATEDPPRAGS